MYIIKNAWKNIWRNKGRNILIGIIVLVISCASAVTLAINNSASKLIDSYENKYDIEATIGINRESMMQNFDPSKNDSKEDMKEQFNNIESLTIDDIKLYGDSNYVKKYYYTNSISMNSSNLEKATSESSSDSNNKFPGMDKMKSDADFKIVGYSSLESMTDFISGNYKMSSGEISSDFDSNSCIINSELATLNEIEVGDTIKIVSPNDEDITYSLKVTGIYEEQENEDNDSKFDMFSNSANTIITNTNTIKKITDKDSDLKSQLNPTFILKNKDVIDKFNKEVSSKGLSEYMSVSTNLDNIESSTSTISNVKTFAITFLIITIIIGGVVLLVINMINIRERKYEIGVLRTIGMKKVTLSLQFITEMLTVTIIFLSLGALIGSFVSVPVSNKLLANEIKSSETDKDNISKNFGNPKDMNTKFNGTINVSEFKSVDAVVDIKVLSELLIIGVCLTLVGSCSSIISIQKFSPLTILKERS